MEPAGHAWTNMISLSVAPVVIISACGLLCLSFYNRLAAIVTRLRSLQRERLSEYKELFRWEDEKKERILQQSSEHFLHYLEGQTVDLLKRAGYLRNCIFCLIVSIFLFVLSSLFIGLSVIFPVLDFIVIVFFVFGLLLLLYGLCFALVEIHRSLNPIQVESGFIQRLIKSELEKSKSK